MFHRSSSFAITVLTAGGLLSAPVAATRASVLPSTTSRLADALVEVGDERVVERRLVVVPDQEAGEYL